MRLDPMLRELAQAGSAKAILPRVHGGRTEVVFLNTAGGLTAGDRLDFALSLTGGAAVGTTQTAERAYRAEGPPAEMAVRLTAGAGARLAWLPQETIVYDGAALRRTTAADLAGDATLLLAETLILGRAAMGEMVRRLSLLDRRSVHRGGRLVWLDPQRLDDAILAGTGVSTTGGMRVFATLAFVAPGAEDALGPVRRCLDAPGVRAAASAWDGRLVLRAMAADPRPVLRIVAQVAERLGGALPRVWQRDVR